VTKTRVLFLASAMSLTLSTGALAQGIGTGGAFKADPFFINLGGQIIRLGSDLQVNAGPSAAGTTIDSEEDLGLKSSPSTWRLDAGWRITDRNQIVFSYYQVNRSGDKSIERAFVYDGYDYVVGGSLHTELDQTYYQLKYRYYFVQRDRGEFGVQVGLSYNDISAGLTLLAYGSGPGTQATLGREVKGSMGAPTATLGIVGSYQFTDRCFFRGDAGWLSLDLNGYDGTVVSLRACVDYYPWKSVGFGCGYEFNGLKIKTDQSDWDGRFKSSLSSFVGYVSFKF